MFSVTHLGQYWSARFQDIRLLAAGEVQLEGGRTRGVALDVSEAGDLPRHRQEVRRVLKGQAWADAADLYRHLPSPAAALAGHVEARAGMTVRSWLDRAAASAAAAGEREIDLASLDVPPARDRDHLVAPIVPRRAQAFGVTYLNSALERETEGARGDYGYVYRSVKERRERPEVFLKGTSPEHFVGPNGKLGLRRDRTNSVDARGAAKERVIVRSGIEPELAAVTSSRGRIWGYTLANDVSGNLIENESLLYLYQAKHFTGCLVLGPLILLSDEQGNPRVDIIARVHRGDRKIFEKATNSSRINSPLGDLVGWARSHLALVPGEVFSTGTDMVPDGEAKVLLPGDRVEIESPAIGALRHVAAEVPEEGDLNPDYAAWEFESAATGK